MRLPNFFDSQSASGISESPNSTFAPQPSRAIRVEPEECFGNHNGERCPNNHSCQQPPLGRPDPQHTQCLKLLLDRGDGLNLLFARGSEKITARRKIFYWQGGSRRRVYAARPFCDREKRG
jgi:hypothetical protein